MSSLQLLTIGREKSITGFDTKQRFASDGIPGRRILDIIRVFDELPVAVPMDPDTRSPLFIAARNTGERCIMIAMWDPGWQNAVWAHGTMHYDRRLRALDRTDIEIPSDDREAHRCELAKLFSRIGPWLLAADHKVTVNGTARYSVSRRVVAPI